MIRQMLNRYDIKSDDDYYNALREIFQEITLAGLYRGNFFKKAAFYGGTALRIFYNLDRFSEDLDFSLLVPEQDFTLNPYFKYIKDEFESLGISVNIESKTKKNISNIESAFLKSNTDIHILSLEYSHNLNRNIKIKFEIDTNPPLDFDTEEKLLLQPFSFFVKCFTPQDLFAGKIHAILFRNWKNRVKGRDWFDLEWYIKSGVKLNLEHLTARARQSNSIGNKEYFTRELLLEMLKSKIEQIDLENAKVDIRRFIKDDTALHIWSKEYFMLLVEKIEDYNKKY